MNAGMCTAYTSVYNAVTLRLPDRSGSQEWPIATSTIARYLALSKNGSRGLPGGAPPWARRRMRGRPGGAKGPGGGGVPVEAVGEARIRLA